MQTPPQRLPILHKTTRKVKTTAQEQDMSLYTAWPEAQHPLGEKEIMKTSILIGIILCTLSTYVAAAETPATPVPAPTSTPTPDAGKAKTDGTNTPSAPKPSIADYCREHTC
jgi:hypothetical protein